MHLEVSKIIDDISKNLIHFPRHDLIFSYSQWPYNILCQKLKGSTKEIFWQESMLIDILESEGC